MGKMPTNSDVQFWRDPDLPGVEVRYSSYHEEAFCNHAHAAYSVGVIETGKTTFYLAGEAYVGLAGRMILIGPNVAHACNPDPDSSMTYRMFYVDVPLLESVTAEVFGHEVGQPHFPEPVVDDPGLVDAWRTLHLAIIEGADRLEKESLFIQGLAELVSRHASLGIPDQPSGNERAVRVVKEYLADNVAEKVNLDTLSQVAGLSRYHLLRLFRDVTGLPPHAYQNQLRVDMGKGLLAGGMSISRAAVETGFADQSHFSRVFRQYTGATPLQYQSSNCTGS
ncbi:MULTISPECIES: AraC family transcriptional regulator [unclassified Pseudodesulfovibrio]|uniref:AraC family transcriptional regulator n=1 Tax=unclassified Pseudodesulfovibrio TaxID=2661612 RepID=UPI000FEB97E0|nr:MULTISPECIES: AraC family transcriptional regulator [unclassified Pseudodesulfovibrio]MCJ2166310.1 AraC family transcriptional regulator [Pseudodesulfovibrio sp. S3-i]RWU02246.1 AraC family transcriptional regulator [Pseudodesulfovibrio sp. S3]